MKLYAISGLGADKRVFDYLKLNCPLICIDWISPEKNESLKKYAQRLAEVIETDEVFGILGVSFGGTIAVEMSKILKPKLTVLISSAEVKQELRWSFRMVGKTGVFKMLPTIFFKPPKRIMGFLFGTKTTTLLNAILDDTDPAFVKWALSALAHWDNEHCGGDTIKISGTKDKLIPPSKNNNSILIEDGQHFMIVDKADEISCIINAEINRCCRHD